MLGQKSCKNNKREQKIIQKVNILENKLLNNINAYMEGKPVDVAIDSLGNEYVFVYIGESTYWSSGEYDAFSNNKLFNTTRARLNNHKTEDIYQMLYNRMSKHGYVLCQHGGVGSEGRDKFSIEGWVLVKENQPVPDKAEENVENKPASENVSELVKETIGDIMSELDICPTIMMPEDILDFVEDKGE